MSEKLSRKMAWRKNLIAQYDLDNAHLLLCYITSKKWNESSILPECILKRISLLLLRLRMLQNMTWQKVSWKVTLYDVYYVFFCKSFVFLVVDKPPIIFTDSCFSIFFYWVFQRIGIVTFWSIKKDVLMLCTSNFQGNSIINSVTTFLLDILLY